MAAQLQEITIIFIGEKWRSPDEDSDFMIGFARLAESHNSSAAGSNSQERISGQFSILGDAPRGDADDRPDGLQPQLEYRLYGHWSNNEKFGRQFAFKTFVKATPHGRAGVIRYLSQCPNIGQATATALWNKFQSDAVRIVRESPDVAAAAIGRQFTTAKAEEAAAYLQKAAALENVTIQMIDLLGGRGFPKSLAKRCIERWGNNAPAVVHTDPYRLMSFKGVGFLKADAMYCDLGLPPAKLKRQAYCATHTVIKECDRHGHTWRPIETAKEGIKSHVGGVEVDPDKALMLASRGKILTIRRDESGQLWVADRRRADAERYVAEKIAEAMGEEANWPEIEYAKEEEQPGPKLHQYSELMKSCCGVVGVFGGSPGTGKAQPLDAKVLTPHGWKLMGEVCAGDFVIGGDGKPVRVAAVFPQGEKEIYRVIMSDGSATECCNEHLWLTHTRNERRWNRTGKVRSLEEIRDTLNRCDRGPNHSIPMVSAVEFCNEKESLPIDPYLMGILLGDGCFRGGNITITNPEPFIVCEATKLLPDECSMQQDKNDPITYRFNGNGERGGNRVTEAIVASGLYGHKSDSKFIPVKYKTASAKDRLSLLQGLLDTDGSCDGYNIEYSTSSEQLAKDVTFLVQSLGGKVSVNSRIPAYSHKGEQRKGKRSYRILVGLPANTLPFRLPRKLEKYRPRTKYPPSRRIEKIEFVGIKKAQCIRVDSQDGLYVTDDFIVTHNTYTIGALARAIIAEHGIGHLAIAAPTGKAAVRCTESLANYGVAIQATTIHRLLVVESAEDGWSFKHNERLPLPFKFLIVDEASMIPIPLMASLLAARARGTHLLFVGDVQQLPPVEHGAPLRDFIVARLPYGELREIKRNAGTIVKACAAIRDNRPFQTDEELRPFDAENPKNLKLIPAGRQSAPDQVLRLVEKIRAQGKVDPVWDVQVVVAVNARSPLSRKALNGQLQGLLNPAGKQVKGSPFRVGDKVIQLKNGFLKLADGPRVEVGGANSCAWNALDGDMEDAPPTWGKNFFKRLTERKRLIEREDEADFQPAAKPKPKDDSTKAFIANGEIGRVLEVAEKKTIVEFSNPKRIVLIPRGNRKGADGDDADGGGDNGSESGGEDEGGSGTGCDLDLAYAVTCHKLQGSQAPVVIVVLDEYPGATGQFGICDRSWLYTAISRAEKVCFLVGKISTARTMCERQSIQRRKTFLVELIREHAKSFGVTLPGDLAAKNAANGELSDLPPDWLNCELDAAESLF